MSTASDNNSLEQSLEDSLDNLDGEPERLEEPEDTDDVNWLPLVGVLFSIGLIAFLVIDGLGAENYFFTVDEAVAQGDTIVGETIRVKGDVVKGTIRGDEGTLGRTFDIAAGGESMTVTYNKAMPDTFKPDVQVVATGTLDSGGHLAADKIMVKCPSRYEGSPPTQHKSGSGPQAAR
jgi:cytochrome c-type biogenesis protein CcmE